MGGKTFIHEKKITMRIVPTKNSGMAPKVTAVVEMIWSALLRTCTAAHVPSRRAVGTSTRIVMAARYALLIRGVWMALHTDGSADLLAMPTAESPRSPLRTPEIQSKY